MINHLINIGIFQVGWFICVTMGNTAALCYTILALFVHQVFFVTNRAEWMLVGIVLIVGCLWDSAMSFYGVLQFDDNGMMPIWLVCLWVLFSTTLLHSLYWLRRYVFFASLGGALFGPFSYWAGATLSLDTQIARPLVSSLLIIAFGWSLIFPISLALAKRVNS